MKQEHYSISSWSITMMAIQVLVYLLAISMIMLITAYSIICNLPWWKHLTNMWQWGLQAMDLWSIIMYKVLINKTRFLYWSQQVNKTSWKIMLQHLEDRILVPPVQTSQEVPKQQIKDIRKESLWAGEDLQITEVWETVNAQEAVNQDTKTLLLLLTWIYAWILEDTNSWLCDLCENIEFYCCKVHFQCL